MTKFEIPPIPTDEVIEKYFNSIESNQWDDTFVNGTQYMRNQLAPHQLAAKRMFEALNQYNCQEDYCIPENTCDNCENIHKAIADVQKIYEVMK